MSALPDSPARTLQRTKRVLVTAQIFACAIHTVVLLSMRGTGHIPILMFIWALGAAGNILIPGYGMPNLGIERAEAWRLVFNLAIHLPLALICEWNLASWLWLPFLAAFASTPSARYADARLAILILAYNVAGGLTGARWQDMLLFSGLCVFLYAVIYAYLELANTLLRQRDSALRELREVQKTVIAQEKMASVGQLAAGVAHEINNPMCFVTANVETLLDDLQAQGDLPPYLIEYRDEILPETVDGIRRVNSIVDDLRRFARGEPEHFERFDLTSEISAAVRMARTQMKPGQALDLDVAPALDITGSPRQICQVVLNLIVNGLQAIPPDGKVRVAAAPCGDSVEIVISDNGSGMSEETKRRLFEPFFTTKARSGIGLGLAVVHGIVKAHGGSIDVESELGEGSRFRMRLPRETARAA